MLTTKLLGGRKVWNLIIALCIGAIILMVLGYALYIYFQEEKEQEARVQSCINGIVAEGKGNLKYLLDERDR